MAFTAWEFVRGAAIAWVLFLVAAPGIQVAVALVPVAFTQPDWPQAILGALTYSVLMGLWLAVGVFLPWSFGALLVLGVPLAIALGLAMRTVADRRIHLACFALLGAAVGLATTLVFVAVNGWDFDPPGMVPAAVVNTLLCGASVAFGWWFTATRALRADAAATAS